MIAIASISSNPAARGTTTFGIQHLLKIYFSYSRSSAQAATPKAQAESPKLPAQADAKHAAPAPLSAEHHAKIWEAVRSEKSAPFAGAKFSITVGEAVPQGIHLYRLPVRVIEFAPQYRGYEYILVGDEILIVDPRTHRIVAVIAA